MTTPTEPAHCLLLESAHIELDHHQPGSMPWWMALTSTARLLSSHGGWRFPTALPASHVRIMLDCERRYHGVRR